MSYLITFDSGKNYTKLLSVNIQPGGNRTFNLGGGHTTARKEPDTFSFSFGGSLPNGTDAAILDSRGTLHYIMILNRGFSLGAGGQAPTYSGIITESTTPDKASVDEIFAQNP